MIEIRVDSFEELRKIGSFDFIVETSCACVLYDIFENGIDEFVEIWIPLKHSLPNHSAWKMTHFRRFDA